MAEDCPAAASVRKFDEQRAAARNQGRLFSLWTALGTSGGSLRLLLQRAIWTIPAMRFANRFWARNVPLGCVMCTMRVSNPAGLRVTTGGRFGEIRVTGPR